MRSDVRIWQVDPRRHATDTALRSVLARWLGEPPSAIGLVRGPHGKPTLAGPGADDVHFNVSRSGDCCLIAVTEAGPIGVDVERVVPFPELEAIVRTRFAPSEAAAILRLDGEHRLRAFYTCWTRKEACLKATGAGLTIALDAVTVSVDDARPSLVAFDGEDPRTWVLGTVRPGPNLIGAVAVRRDASA